MKIGVALLVGMLLGVGGMWLRGKVEMTSISQVGDAASSQDEVNPIPRRLSERLRERERFSQSRRGSLRVSSTDELTNRLLEGLCRLDEGVEMVNVMELLRLTHEMANLREDEALEILKMRKHEWGDREEAAEAMMILAFCRLCELNGPEAMRMAAGGEFEEVFYSEEISVMGMKAWVSADPEGVMSWFERQVKIADQLGLEGRLDDGLQGVLVLFEGDEFVQVCFEGLVNSDPDGTRSQIDRLKCDEVREVLYEVMNEEFLKMRVREEDGVAGLLELLNESAVDSGSHDMALDVLIDKDVEEAVKWMESQTVSSSGDYRIMRIANVLMKEDRESGVEWYMSRQFFDIDAESRRLTDVVNAFASDPERAEEWLSCQEDGEVRNQAEIAMVNILISSEDWKASMNWIKGVNEAERGQLLNWALISGWDSEKRQIVPELMKAAEDSGFGNEATTFRGFSGVVGQGILR